MGQQFWLGQVRSWVSVSSGICAACYKLGTCSLELLTETLLLSNQLGWVTGSKTSRSGWDYWTMAPERHPHFVSDECNRAMNEQMTNLISSTILPYSL